MFQPVHSRGADIIESGHQHVEKLRAYPVKAMAFSGVLRHCLFADDSLEDCGTS